jgi:predicted nucleic acid-binding protein
LQQIFVDSAAWIAMEVSNDQYHAAAQRFARGPALSYRWVTTNWVLWETVTWLRRRSGYETTVRFAERVRASTQVERLAVSEAHEETAWKLFKRFADKEFGFTDCSSFAVMQSYGIRTAFTFDVHFRRAGFTVLPTLD